MTTRYFSGKAKDEVQRMYPEIPFTYDNLGGNGDIFQATASTSILGKFEKSHAVRITGYDYNQEKTLIYQSPNWEQKQRDVDKKIDQLNRMKYSALTDKDPLEGHSGWQEKGGKQLFFGVIGLLFGVTEIAAGATGVGLILSSVSVANEVDNIMGVVIYEGGESFIVKMSEDKEVKLIVQGFKTAIDVVDTGTDIKDIFTSKAVSEKIFNAAAAADDGASIVSLRRSAYCKFS